MKNRIYLSIISAILLLTVCFTACKAKEENVSEENLSYCQTDLYTGEDKDMVVTLSAGSSEKLFVADGKTNEVGTFTLLKVTPTSRDLMEAELSYILKGEKGVIEDRLSKDAFGAYFSAEPDLSVTGEPISVTIINGEARKEILLTDETLDRISAGDALKIAKEKLKKQLTDDNKEREIYVRLINNADKPNSEYYWYVAFLANPTDYYSALIDANGNVVSFTPNT